MLIQRKSQMSGNVNTMDLDITQDQIDRWNSGELIQHVMPNLTPDEREFLITGITAEEWDSVFSDE